MSTTTAVPPCKWAQRRERVYLTVGVTDPQHVRVDIEPTRVAFAGVSKAGPFAHTFNLLREIVPAESSYKALGRELQINLKKADAGAGGFWERLTAEPARASKAFLSCDWDRWVDEDEDRGEDDDFGLGDMDLGGGGMDSDDDADAPLDDLDAPSPEAVSPGSPEDPTAMPVDK